MLYIQNYTKFDLDKSSQSMYRYYTSLLEDLNNAINDIREYLVNMLDEIDSLRTSLQEVKSDLQESLNNTKDAYSSHGYTNNALDTVQKLLDESESNLDDLESKVNSAIESLDCNEELPADCEQVCTFTADCAESDYDCQEQATPTQSDSDCGLITDDCAYCAYGAINPDCNDADNACAEKPNACNVCFVDGEIINVECNQKCDQGINTRPCSEEGWCKYYFDDSHDCIYGFDEECAEIVCHAGVDLDIYCDDTIICYVSSACSEIQIPSDCDFTDKSDTDCGYDSSDCTYSSNYCAESTCPGDDDNNHYYLNDEDENGCRYDSESGYSDNCTNFCDYDADDPNHSNPDCGDSGCSYDPEEDGVDCEAGDDYDPTCDQLSDDDDSGGDSNVICTYIINRLHLGKEYLSISADNLKIGFRNGITKDILREYMYGLGPNIINHLAQESDEDVEVLWENTIKPIWVELRLRPNYGVHAYIEFVRSLCVRYNVDYKKYPHLSLL